ncbi:MAG: hypothetical protein O2955_20830 [Planctomycetota bacterium]|nr:hypothetical protein [Planctomycetota bacterium]MDA1214956.1 hypothetical protein [Planctomycetota bacterium]
MNPAKLTLLLPILLITVGTGWLLTALEIAPNIDWIWTLGLLIVGVMTFVLGGFDKATFVVGGFFIIASSMSVLRQTGRITLNIEVPVLVIASGVLMIFARSSKIPTPGWVQDSPPQSNVE